MIQINLIPELKAEFLKAQKAKRTVVGISVIITGAFMALVVLLFLHVNVNQRNHTNNLEDDISSLASEYAAVEDLDKIITVQKQLQTLPGLHDSKPLVSRLPKYLTIITPEKVEISRFELNIFDTQSITISGRGDTVTDVNVLADTIKNATFSIGDDDTKYSPFSNVILENINTDKEGTVFEISFVFDQQLFTNPDDIKLTVPKGDFTLSEVESPKASGVERQNDLFDSEEEQQ